MFGRWNPFCVFSFVTCVLQPIFCNAQDTECPLVIINNNNLNEMDRREDSNRLRLMQYNVEWLFLDYNSASDCPGNGCTWHNESEANIHLDHVFDVIDTINPDIINFCEIEGCDELKVLQGMFDNGIYNPYLIQGSDTATGQNVGMLTKIDPIYGLNRSEEKAIYPIDDSECGYTGNPSHTGVSKHYMTEFNINGYKIALISAHLIAYPTDASRCAKREAQASILQSAIMNYTNKGYEIVMMGDFNDYDGEVKDMNNHTPTSKVLNILKGHHGEYANQYELHSVAEYLKQAQRFSEWFDSDNNCNTSSRSDYSMIDHILVSPKLQDIIKSVNIYHGYREYCGKYDSDHYPVIVDFQF